MKSLPLVTIVTPSFNQAQFLEETLQSVIRQDYPHIEHIVVDGASTDGSLEILRMYQQHLASWVSAPDHGQSHAINKGFARASGSILAWLNSDDLLAPSAVRIAVEYLQTDASIGAVYGDRIHIDQKGNVLNFTRGPSFYPRMLSRNITLPQETVFFRQDLYEQVGGLDENLTFGMDFDLWCRMTQIACFRHIPAFMGYFREHRESKSVAYHREQTTAADEFLREHARVYRRHFRRNLPGPLGRRLYRLFHKVRWLTESRSNRHAAEKELVRRVIHSSAAGSAPTEKVFAACGVNSAADHPNWQPKDLKAFKCP